MATFIEVTEAGKEGKKVLINLNLVLWMSRRENDTEIQFLTGDYYLKGIIKTRETPEELLKAPRL